MTKGYKKCLAIKGDDCVCVLVELEIPDDAQCFTPEKIYSLGRCVIHAGNDKKGKEHYERESNENKPLKSRASHARVTKIHGGFDVVYGLRDRKLAYRVGDTVTPDSFDPDEGSACSNGIHFFLNKDDAINYSNYRTLISFKKGSISFMHVTKAIEDTETVEKEVT